MRAAGLLVVAAGLLAVSPGSAQTSWEHPALERLASPELRTFEGEREYRAYVRNLRRAQREIYFDRRNARAEAGQGGPVIVVAQADLAYDCDPQYEDCGDLEASIVVTGARVASSPQSTPLAVTSITNNQVAAVDEGDIVKRIGDYLLVLQDGRIFSANFRTMELADRIDVYRRDEDGDPRGADWYDEMLVQGDHVLVTAYSYEEEATELSVFRLDQASGRIERRGVFLISSEDYYDADNYATRVVGDRLVIYTPFEPEDLVDRGNRPVIRSWRPSDDFVGRERGGRPILSVEDIHLPVFGVEEPVVHMISVCALGNLDRDSLPCDTTGFIAGEQVEMFVSSDNIFLATTATHWRDLSVAVWCNGLRGEQVVSVPPPPGAVFRLPLRRGEPDLLAVRGQVIDQFSMDQQGNRFRMVETSPTYHCSDTWWRPNDVPIALELVDERIGDFVRTWRPAPERRFTRLPAAGAGMVENRFIGEWLLYGTRTRYGRPPEGDDRPEPPAAIAVPLGNAAAAVRLELGHEITRLESLGGDAIATGYRDASGLNVSYIELGESARIADSTLLADRFESESRSHAFNATVRSGGEGVMGLPTVLRVKESDRLPWRSDDSQISFLAFDRAGSLADIGQISPAMHDGDEPEGYTCEVSCVDWYGNARPIFIEDMAYALMGTELVEARPSADRIVELRRLLLTRPDVLDR
jgi:hypothetical protein